MATTVEPSSQPLAENQQTRVAEAELEKLDLLFETYLTTLDQYQKARQELSLQLSSGFMSLAQANFSNKGRRYGRDYYDERMQAGKKVSITSYGESGSIYKFTLQDTNSRDDVEEDASKPRTASDGNGDTTNSINETAAEETKSKGENQQFQDPIRWFGLLVPPALRSTQASFKQVVEHSSPRLITLQQQLRSLEIDIGRARKAIKKLEKA